MKTIIRCFVILIMLFSFYPAQSGYIDFSEWDLSLNSVSKIPKIGHALDGKEAEIKGLGLSQNRITNAQFNEITESLDPAKYLALKILNLNDNMISAEAAPSLLRWLSLPSSPIINISGNPSISLKNISKLYAALEQLGVDSLVLKEHMQRIIFMSSQYVTKAKSSVEIYNTHVASGIIPEDWDQRHKQFYASEMFKKLQAQRGSDRLQKCMEGMKTLAATTPKIAASSAAELNLQEEDTEGLSVEKALIALTFNPHTDE